MKSILMSMALVLTAAGALFSQSLDDPPEHEPQAWTSVAELLMQPVEVDCGAPNALLPNVPATPQAARIRPHKQPAQVRSDASASVSTSNCIIVCKS
jgi:hypothetical protein